MTETTGCYGAH